MVKDKDQSSFNQPQYVNAYTTKVECKKNDLRFFIYFPLHSKCCCSRYGTLKRYSIGGDKRWLPTINGSNIGYMWNTFCTATYVSLSCVIRSVEEILTNTNFISAIIVCTVAFLILYIDWSILPSFSYP